MKTYKSIPEATEALTNDTECAVCWMENNLPVSVQILEIKKLPWFYWCGLNFMAFDKNNRTIEFEKPDRDNPFPEELSEQS